jgi:hypothetical protein
MKQAIIVRINFTKTDNYIIEQKVPEADKKSKHHKVRGKILHANYKNINEAINDCNKYKYQLIQY